MNKKLQFLWYGIGVAVLVVLDQWLKIWSIANLKGQPPRNLISGFIQLTYLENTGAAFGFLSNFGGAQWLLAGYKLVVLVVAIAYFVKLPGEPRFTLLRVPLALIIAGGIGNLIDRVRFGFVVDMLEFEFVRFPVFNLADVYVTTGICAFALFVLFVVKDAPLFGVKEKEAAT